MLVLSRKIGQRIAIGGGIVITVVAARGSQVRIGVEAPQDVIVLREELTAPDTDLATAAGPACPSPDRSPAGTRSGSESIGRRSR